MCQALFHELGGRGLDFLVTMLKELLFCMLTEGTQSERT